MGLARVAQSNDSAAVTVGNPLQYVSSILLTKYIWKHLALFRGG
jgi:hypothetical protein